MDPVSAAAASLLAGWVADKGSEEIRQRFTNKRFWKDLTTAVSEHESVDSHLFQPDKLKLVVDDLDFWVHLRVPNEPLTGAFKHKLGELYCGPAAPDPVVVIGAIHDCLIRALFKHSTLAEREQLRRQAESDETQLHVINYLTDTYEVVEATSDTVNRIEDLLVAEITDQQRHATDGDPFLIADVDLVGWDMVSGRIGNVVPDYIPRDIDTQLDAKLSNPELGFVVISGPTKSGKTRCLLEGLRRNVGDAVVVKTERLADSNVVKPCVSLLDGIDHAGSKVLFIDDLFEYLEWWSGEWISRWGLPLEKGK